MFLNSLENRFQNYNIFPISKRYNHKKGCQNGNKANNKHEKRDLQRGKQTNKQTERLMERQADSQTDRQTNSLQIKINLLKHRPKKRQTNKQKRP